MLGRLAGECYYATRYLGRLTGLWSASEPGSQRPGVTPLHSIDLESGHNQLSTRRDLDSAAIGPRF